MNAPVCAPPNSRQRTVLWHLRRHGGWLTPEELSERTGLRNVMGVLQTLRACERRGWVRSRRDRWRIQDAGKSVIA